MRTLKEGSRALKGFLKIEPAIGRVGYYVWPGGVVPPEGGAGASNAPPLPIQRYINYGRVFCAWVPNIMLRTVGKRVPRAERQSAYYDGGIAAYWGTPSYDIGAGYYQGYMHAFDLETALKWAYDDRIPVLIGWKYTGVAVAQQGHVALIMPSGWVLESVPGSGLRWVKADYTSYAVNHATVMVRGRDWIEYSGDEF